jgi:transposase
MFPPPEQADLFPFQDPSPSTGTVAISARSTLRTKAGERVVLVLGIPIAHFAVGDRMAEGYAMVTLADEGWADQIEIAHAFGCSTRTVRRMQRRFDKGGLCALGRSPGFPKGLRRASAARSRRVHDLKAKGLSNRAIAQRVGITENAVRKLLLRLGWKPPEVRQADLPLQGAHPNLSAFSTPSTAASMPTTQEMAAGAPIQHATPQLVAAPCAHPNLSASSTDEPLPFTCDTDPADRRMDRLFAFLGLLDDAAPLFRSGSRIPRAGVLLAVPSLVHSGVFHCTRDIYGSIGPAFYGLRTTVLALLLLALLRIKRPEALKEHAPDDLGRLLGLDRAPEVKTLRRKLTRLAALGCATSFGRALAERRVAAHGAALGFLYVDGHVRVYHGKRTIPKAHVARMRIALPATSDYWVNDAVGEPLFVITAEANAGMVKMLQPVLDEVRQLVGTRPITIVFDRGGWSPRLFQKIVAQGFDILTYRKGRFRRLPKRCFHERAARINGIDLRYVLADQKIRLLGGRLRLRQVTRLSENGHQTPIITSRDDLEDFEVAFRMFERWRQENFFKYMREEYALDALVDYQVQDADPAREVPNPRWNEIDSQVREARAQAGRLALQYGFEAFTNMESVRKTMRGFKIANASQGRQIQAAMQRLADLEARRTAVPRRVPVQDVVVGQVVKLATERKHLTNLLKMVAYQAEGDLLRLLTPHYKRVDDEGRTLIQSALASAADLRVTDTELRVTLAPLSSAHRTRAIAALCDQLNLTAACFPGTRLQLRFAIVETAAEPVVRGRTLAHRK